MKHFSNSAGGWRGSNGFRLMPSDPLVDRPARATLAVASGGHLTSLTYTWQHPEDDAQEGLLVFGPGADDDSIVGLWGDSWHQQPAPMSMTGSVLENSVELWGSYGSGWRWRIEVRTAAGSALTMQMENVIPTDRATEEVSAGPYVVMLMELRRI